MMTDIDLKDLDARLKRWFAGLSYEKFGPEHAAALLDALADAHKRIEELEKTNASK